MYAGYANGDVIAIDIASWQASIVLRGGGAVQDIAATDHGATIAVATGDGTIHVGSWREGALTPERGNWTALAARALHVKLTPDGLLIAACTDGTIWLYSVPRARWLCLPTGTADITRTVVSPDGKAAVALEREGRLLKIDLEAARTLLAVSSRAPTQAKEP